MYPLKSFSISHVPLTHNAASVRMKINGQTEEAGHGGDSRGRRDSRLEVGGETAVQRRKFKSDYKIRL